MGKEEIGALEKEAKEAKAATSTAKKTHADLESKVKGATRALKTAKETSGKELEKLKEEEDKCMKAFQKEEKGREKKRTSLDNDAGIAAAKTSDMQKNLVEAKEQVNVKTLNLQS